MGNLFNYNRQERDLHRAEKSLMRQITVRYDDTEIKLDLEKTSTLRDMLANINKFREHPFTRVICETDATALDSSLTIGDLGPHTRIALQP